MDSSCLLLFVLVFFAFFIILKVTDSHTGAMLTLFFIIMSQLCLWCFSVFRMNALFVLLHSRLIWSTVCGTATSTSTTVTCPRSLYTPPSRRLPRCVASATHSTRLAWMCDHPFYRLNGVSFTQWCQTLQARHVLFASWPQKYSIFNCT